MNKKITQAVAFALLYSLCCSSIPRARANDQEKRITYSARNVPLWQLFRVIKKQTDLTVFASQDILDFNEKVSVSFKQTPLQDALRQLFGERDLTWTIDDAAIILHQAKGPQKSPPADTAEDPVKITGKVTDEANNPLPGVGIVVKGTSNGTMTGTDGSFTLNSVPADAVLVFSMVGFQTREVPVDSRAIIDVTMEADIARLDEVVVVGYGEVKKSDLTGSVSSVDGDIIEKLRPSSFEQALAGRAPGVVVTRNSGIPGAGASIKIRGVNSMTGSDPLYVIDGIPMDNTDFSRVTDEAAAGATISPLSSINPSDIESIEILKDASATAIYGSRGANGVVIVTTKQGVKGKSKVSVTANYGLSDFISERKPDLLNANEYIILSNEAIRNGQPGTNPYRESYLDSAGRNLIPGYDWQDVIYRTSHTQDYNLNLSGGNDQVTYMVAGNLFDAKGIILKSNYRRYAGRFNLDASLNNWLTAGARISVASVNSTEVNTSTDYQLARGTNSVVQRALRAIPVTNPFNEDGSYYNSEDGVEYYSPLVAIQANNIDNLSAFSTTSAFLTAKLPAGFTARTQFSYNVRNTNLRFYQTDELPDAYSLKGWARTNDSRVRSWSVENTLSYRGAFDKHVLNAVVGQTAQGYDYEALLTSNYGFANDLLGIYAMPTATFYTPDQAGHADSKLLSFLGRLNYTYNSKYLLTLTARADGSSKFAANNKFGFFPAAAIAYRLSEEDFMRDSRVVSNLKLRASYGLSGNQALAPYQSLAQLSADKKVFGDGNGGETFSTYYASSQLANKDLKWETTAQLDLGLDLGLFRDRLSLTADYYDKLTSDLLVVGYRISAISGFNTATVNLGEMSTKGFDLGINAFILDKKNFTWNAALNLSLGKTKIKYMGVDSIMSGMPHFWVAGTQRLLIGEELGTFWGYKRNGIAQFSDFEEFYDGNGNLMSPAEMAAIYQANPTATYTPRDGNYPTNLAARPGEQLYQDLNGDGIINESDQTALGTAQPDMVFGFRNELRFKNIDLSIFIDGKWGMEICNMTNFQLLSFDHTQQLKTTLQRWTPENPSEVYPRVSSINSSATNFRLSDRFIEDASFTRIQNITLGYEFRNPSTLKLSRLRLYASVSNVYTFTDYSGYSPDVSLAGSNNLRMGFDNAAYPVPRTVSFGLNAEF